MGGDRAAETALKAALSGLSAVADPPPPGPPTLTAVPSAAPDWDNLAAALHRVVGTAVPLLRADGAGLMLADPDGTLHVVTGGDQDEQTFERAERDLGEGPCIDAFTSGEAEAIRAYAMLCQLIGSATDARHKGELAAQRTAAIARPSE